MKKALISAALIAPLVLTSGCSVREMKEGTVVGTFDTKQNMPAEFARSKQAQQTYVRYLSMSATGSNHKALAFNQITGQAFTGAGTTGKLAETQAMKACRSSDNTTNKSPCKLISVDGQRAKVWRGFGEKVKNLSENIKSKVNKKINK